MSVVWLGRACGKTKYALLDEADHKLTEKFALEPKVEADRNGCGVRTIVWAFDRQHGRGSGKYLHELIWLMHKGTITHRHTVVHKNGITMDNRLGNLVLADADSKLASATNDSIIVNRQQATDYWEIIRHVKFDPLQEFMYYSSTCGNQFYSADGDCFCVEDGSTVFYECHNPPCCVIERLLRQFKVCGRCRLVRYCSAECQELDWAVHRKFCRLQTSPEEDVLDR